MTGVAIKPQLMQRPLSTPLHWSHLAGHLMDGNDGQRYQIWRASLRSGGIHLAALVTLSIRMMNRGWCSFNWRARWHRKLKQTSQTDTQTHRHTDAVGASLSASISISHPRNGFILQSCWWESGIAPLLVSDVTICPATLPHRPKSHWINLRNIILAHSGLRCCHIAPRATESI